MPVYRMGKSKPKGTVTPKKADAPKSTSKVYNKLRGAIKKKG